MNTFGLLATEVLYTTIAGSIGINIEQIALDNNLNTNSQDIILSLEQDKIELSITEQSDVNLEQVEII